LFSIYEAARAVIKNSWALSKLREDVEKLTSKRQYVYKRD
jgi:hypothetical protein